MWEVVVVVPVELVVVELVVLARCGSWPTGSPSARRRAISASKSSSVSNER